jgi:hypothetical protein
VASAEQINAFAQLGLGELCYTRVLDCVDVLRLTGIGIAPTETAVALLDADGSPRLIRGTIADVMLAAEQHGVAVAPLCSTCQSTRTTTRMTAATRRSG